MSSVAIIGGGHAGIEASLACAKLNCNVMLFILDPLSIGRLSCNPSIGGLAKGHLVKEIDALGGAMGFLADFSCLQFKMLNKSKGRAVWSPRSQVDKNIYSKKIQSIIKNNEKIKIIKDEIINVLIKNNTVLGVVGKSGKKYFSDSVIITTGTFMNGLIHIGNYNISAGRLGERASTSLTENLKQLGFEMGRLKTGTPPRLEKKSINWSALSASFGDSSFVPFSSLTQKSYIPKNIPTHIAYTNAESHQIIKKNVLLSPMFTGKIKGVGPRYCPSIEDKIIRFSDRPKHQLYLEEEWLNSNQIYINGFSTSLPKEIQELSLNKIKGLENCKIIRPGYAIEYDYFPSRQLKATLETKKISGLFFAGQINGTSGYEEAASQGLMAGINAGLLLKGKKPFVLGRSEAYLGVLIDDLNTLSINEPYRMFTSSAEFRLSLRADTAGLRLTEYAANFGLISKKQYNSFSVFKSSIKDISKILNETKLSLCKDQKPEKAFRLLKKTNISISSFFNKIPSLKNFDKNALFTTETNIKYEGYVSRETSRAQTLLSADLVKIPQKIIYSSVPGLSKESIEKLSIVLPETLGQASRIAGVRMADVFILSFYIKKHF